MKQEDYVSYEIAKLLKEKGFDWECIGYYVDYEPNDVKYSFLGETNSTWESRCCSAPTPQMAKKWINEVCKLYITIKPYITEEGIMYLFEIYKLEREKFTLLKSKTGFEKPELAENFAIKYCLENLI